MLVGAVSTLQNREEDVLHKHQNLLLQMPPEIIDQTGENPEAEHEIRRLLIHAVLNQPLVEDVLDDTDKRRDLLEGRSRVGNDFEQSVKSDDLRSKSLNLILSLINHFGKKKGRVLLGLVFLDEKISAQVFEDQDRVLKVNAHILLITFLLLFLEKFYGISKESLGRGYSAPRDASVCSPRCRVGLSCPCRTVQQPCGRRSTSRRCRIRFLAHSGCSP